MSQFRLLGQRRFWPLFWTQFCGAFNDNLFKNALALMLTFGVAVKHGYDPALWVPIGQGLFVLPFFLFSAFSGQLADKLEKSLLIRWVKLLEILVMLAAALAFFVGSIPLLVGALFLMGLQSTLFGPVKFSILPQILADSELVGGNALVESGTFLAILLGTIGGGVLIGLGESGPQIVAVSVVAVAVLGYLFARALKPVAASAPEIKISYNIFATTWQMIGHARKERAVFYSILGISWFWFFGATLLTLLPTYTHDVVRGDAKVVTLFLVVFCVGVAVGSLGCEKMARHRIELGLVPLGAIGMTAFCLDLAWASLAWRYHAGDLLSVGRFLSAAGSLRILIDLFGIAAFGGFFIVPLYALMQGRADPAHRARVIAANNILNAFFMVLSALMTTIFAARGIGPVPTYLVLALLNAAVAWFIFGLIPEFLIRFLVWLLIHTIYRLRIRGAERIPDEGPLVLAANHVTFVDGLIVSAVVKRPVRFVMYYRYARMPILRFLVDKGGAIPIAGHKEDPQVLQQAMDTIAEALAAGEVVCIFPEGRLTSDGQMNEFRPGIERIVERTPATVVPLALGNLWGSIFSRDKQRLFGVLPKRFWSKVDVNVGEPIAPGELSAAALEHRVAALLDAE
ncbi:MAG: MFS transporter [Deltaproteobacteria bacterium]|nr:MFS transporter [Deltaproteobacteria bacterium]